MGITDAPFFSKLDVETQALFHFAEDLTTAFMTSFKPSLEGLKDLGLHVGGSAIPGAAKLANWNATVTHTTGVHTGKLGESQAALSTGAVSVGTIYQNADNNAAVQMNTVNDTFNPKAGTPSLESDRNAPPPPNDKDKDRIQAIDNDLVIQAQNTSLGENGQAATSPAAPSNVCVAPGYDPQSASAAVNEHITQSQNNYPVYSGGYQAPANTPTQFAGKFPGAPTAPPKPSASPGPAPTTTYGAPATPPAYQGNWGTTVAPAPGPTPTPPAPSGSSRPSSTSTTAPGPTPTAPGPTSTAPGPTPTATA